MSNDGFFWAGVSGKRAENIRQLQDNISQWRQHVEELELTIQELRRSRLYWFNTAVGEGATAQVYADNFKKFQGKGLAATIGRDEVDRQIDNQKDVERKHTFLKYWDPSL